MDSWLPVSPLQVMVPREVTMIPSFCIVDSLCDRDIFMIENFAVSCNAHWAVCYAANIEKEILTDGDLNPETHPSEHFVLTTRLTHTAQRARHQAQVSQTVVQSLEEHLSPTLLTPHYPMASTP